MFSGSWASIKEYTINLLVVLCLRVVSQLLLRHLQSDTAVSDTIDKDNTCNEC